MAFKNPPVKKNRQVHEITKYDAMPTYDFPSDKVVLSLLKKARKLGLCHCTDQASFKESSLCCCLLYFMDTLLIIVHLSLTLTLCSLVELPAPAPLG